MIKINLEAVIVNIAISSTTAIIITKIILHIFLNNLDKRFTGFINELKEFNLSIIREKLTNTGSDKV